MRSKSQQSLNKLENKKAKIRAGKLDTKPNNKKQQKQFPTIFPFWARFKKNKNRTTLIIDEELVKDNANLKEDMFVHRESTHSYKKDYEEIKPNPDVSDKRPMYLKRASKKPKRMFEPHNKKLNMPKHLKDRYDKNNYK